MGWPGVDASGVVSKRSTIQVLGWRCGDELHLTLVAGSVVVRRAPGGVVTLRAKPYLVLPLAVRRRCGLRAGDQVLVAADPNHGVLVVYPPAALDSMIVALVGGDDDDQPGT